MEAMRFLIVEFTGRLTPYALLTRDHAGCTIDLMAEPVPEGEAPGVHPTLALIKGLPWRDTEAAVAMLGARYGPVEAIRRDPRGMSWLGRFRIHDSALVDPGTRALARFQHRFGAPWVHIASGIVHVRARIPDSEGGELLAEVRAHLAAAGVEAQADLCEMAPRDYGVWEELVQLSIGLAQ